MEQKNSSFSTNSSNSGNTNTSFRKGPRTPKPQNLFSAPTVKDILNSDDMVPIRIHGTENSLAKSPVKSTPSISEGVELSIPQLTVENSDFRKLLDSVQDSDALNVIGNAKQAKNTMKVEAVSENTKEWSKKLKEQFNEKYTTLYNEIDSKGEYNPLQNMRKDKEESEEEKPKAKKLHRKGGTWASTGANLETNKPVSTPEKKSPEKKPWNFLLKSSKKKEVSKEQLLGVPESHHTHYTDSPESSIHPPSPSSTNLDSGMKPSHSKSISFDEYLASRRTSEDSERFKKRTHTKEKSEDSLLFSSESSKNYFSTFKGKKKESTKLNLSDGANSLSRKASTISLSDEYNRKVKQNLESFQEKFGLYQHVKKPSLKSQIQDQIYILNPDISTFQGIEEYFSVVASEAYRCYQDQFDKFSQVHEQEVKPWLEKYDESLHTSHSEFHSRIEEISSSISSLLHETIVDAEENQQIMNRDIISLQNRLGLVSTHVNNEHLPRLSALKTQIHSLVTNNRSLQTDFIDFGYWVLAFILNCGASIIWIVSVIYRFLRTGKLRVREVHHKPLRRRGSSDTKES